MTSIFISTRKNDIIKAYNSENGCKANKQKELIIDMLKVLAGRSSNDADLNSLLKFRIEYFKSSDGLTESARGLFSQLIKSSQITSYQDIEGLFSDDSLSFTNEEIKNINNKINELRQNLDITIANNRYNEAIKNIGFLTIPKLKNLLNGLDTVSRINQELNSALTLTKSQTIAQVSIENSDIDLFSQSLDLVALAKNNHFKESDFNAKIIQLTEKISELDNQITSFKGRLQALRENNAKEELNKEIDETLILVNNLDSLKDKLNQDLIALKERLERYTSLKKFFEFKCDSAANLSLDGLSQQIEIFNAQKASLIQEFPDNTTICDHYATITKAFTDAFKKQCENLANALSSQLIADFIGLTFNDPNSKQLLNKYQMSLTDKTVKFSATELEYLQKNVKEICNKLGEANNSEINKRILSVFTNLNESISNKLEQLGKYENDLDSLVNIKWNDSESIAQNRARYHEAINKFEQIKNDSNEFQLDLTSGNLIAIEQQLSAFIAKITQVQAIKEKIDRLTDCQNVTELAKEWGNLYKSDQTIIDSVSELQRLKAQVNQRIQFVDKQPDIDSFRRELQELNALLNDQITTPTSDQIKNLFNCLQKCLRAAINLKQYSKGLESQNFRLVIDAIFLQNINDIYKLQDEVLTNLEQLPAKFTTYSSSFTEEIKNIISKVGSVFRQDLNIIPSDFNIDVIASYIDFHTESVQLTSTLTESVRTLHQNNEKLRTTIMATITTKQKQLQSKIEDIKKVKGQFSDNTDELTKFKDMLAKLPELESCMEFSNVLTDDINNCDKLLGKLNSRLVYYKSIYEKLGELNSNEEKFINKYRGKELCEISKGISFELVKYLRSLNSNRSITAVAMEKTNKIADDYAQYLYAKIKAPADSELKQLLTYEFNDFKNDSHKAKTLKAAFISQSQELDTLQARCDMLITTLNDENKTISEFKKDISQYTNKEDKSNQGRLNKILSSIRKLNSEFLEILPLIANDKEIIKNLTDKIQQIKFDLNVNYTLEDLIIIFNFINEQLHELKKRATNIQPSIDLSYDYTHRYLEIKGSDMIPLRVNTLSNESILIIKKQFIHKAINKGFTIDVIRDNLNKINSGLEVLKKIFTYKEQRLIDGDRKKLRELFKIFAFIANKKIGDPNSVKTSEISLHIKNKFSKAFWKEGSTASKFADKVKEFLTFLDRLFTYFTDKNPVINEDDIKISALLLDMFYGKDTLSDLDKYDGKAIANVNMSSIGDSHQELDENLSFFEKLAKLQFSEVKQATQSEDVCISSDKKLYDIIKENPNSRLLSSDTSLSQSMIF